MLKYKNTLSLNDIKKKSFISFKNAEVGVTYYKIEKSDLIGESEYIQLRWKKKYIISPKLMIGGFAKSIKKRGEYYAKRIQI